MKFQNKIKIELLAPAKNFMAIKASGPYADAVYLGADVFNMRMKADNFVLEDLPKVVKMCHNPSDPSYRRRKVYLTVNILIYENELNSLKTVIQAAKKAKIDAVIVHDFAAISLAKEIGIPFHISTQCNVSNSIAAKSYETLGAERIILARECSLKQIKEISGKLNRAEIETFIHGAMCSSISGRCYLSQTIACSNKKSANRGLCTQPCRGEWTLKYQDGPEFLYDGKRILNSRDLCMINYVPNMIEAGIKSLKIEGRMRHPHYVETVSRIYREAIDAYYNGNFKEQKKKQRWITQLKKIYNRGYTTGFFFHMATEKDSQLYNPANMSHYRYIEMGRIKIYFPTKIAMIELTNGTLKIGDEIIVMSTNSKFDTYFHQKIKDIRIKGKDVKKTPLGRINKPIDFTTKMDQPVNEDRIDAIYKFTDETYSRGKKGTYRLK